MTNLVRAANAEIKIHRPDGSVIEYSGPADEFSIIVSQLEKRPNTLVNLYRLANVFNRLQPLIWGIFAVFAAWLMLSWVLRPAAEYQPQSLGVGYEQIG